MAKARHIPERKCVACGQRLAKRELVRIVRGPQGAALVDLSGRRPGRGAYLCRSPLCWQRGVHKAGLERSLNINLSAENRDQLLATYQEMVAELRTGGVTNDI